VAANALRVVSMLLLALACVAARARGADEPIQVGIFHPLACLPSAELKADVYIYNRSKTPQRYTGEVADDKGNLALTGDWDLVLEEVKDGKVVSTKSLRPAERGKGESHELKANGDERWSLTLSVAKLTNHTGNYRFRVSNGQSSRTGRLFRVAESLDAPAWVALSYVPDKARCFLGEAVTVHFTLKNNGTDEFHFEEGGDYRGASRHLRFAFAAENQKGDKAVDPLPNQPCFGGLGMSDPHVKPGGVYEKKLPLLAYLKFPAPGTYRVRCYQAMGFGTPVEGIAATDDSGGWGGYAAGGSFDLELRLPTEQEATAVLRSLLDGTDPDERWRAFHFLYHPCYLAPIEALLKNETNQEKTDALIEGIGSIMTVEATRRLLALAEDPRVAVRLGALRRLSWRLPDPRDTGKAQPDGPFVLYPRDARRRDVAACWDEALRPALRTVLTKGLESPEVEEVSACAYCLGALGETDTVDLLAAAADRVAPGLALPKPNEACANEIASAACVLAQLGAKPCKADKASSPGRLAVWANMVRTRKEYRTGDWQGLILHMLALECPVTRMAAIRWLPEDFAPRGQIPWRKLFLEKDDQIWWHAIQIARQTFPPELKAVAEECLRDNADERKRRDLEELLKEIAARAVKKAP